MKKTKSNININWYFILLYFILLLILSFIFFYISIKIIFKKVCVEFDRENYTHYNKYSNLVRETQLYSDCNKKPSFSIKKNVYYNNEIMGVVTNNNILILKGTDDLYLVFKDISIKKTNFYEGKIHSQVYKIVQEIYKQIKDENINLICGWSLGSMIGICTAYDFYKKTNRKINLFLFGCPPVGDYIFKENYNKVLYNNTIIVNNNRDILAYPFGFTKIGTFIINKIFGYYHVGNYNNLDFKYKYNNIYSNFGPFKYHLIYF